MTSDWSTPTLYGATEPLAARSRPKARPVGRPDSQRPAANTTAADHRGIGPWPGLDGLRAFAVAAVVVYHLGADWLPGGFLGVDVFFVLSGFLITSLLVNEWQRTSRLRIGQFYLRRARRLFPALYAMLAVVVLATAALASYRLSDLRGDVIAALLYVTNWTQILWNQSYFRALGPPSLLEHLWSLALEEQFYLIWPVVLLACLSNRRRNLALTIAVLGIITSTLLMAFLFHPYQDPSRVYYGSDTHAAPILIGAAMALLRRPPRAHARRRPANSWSLDVLALAGAAVIAYSMADVTFNQARLYRGGFVVVALATVLVIRAGITADTWTARALSLALLRWLGVRSYAIYLWHWPIIQLSQPEFHPPLSGFALDAARVGLTLVAADLSYRLIERPIRSKGFVAAISGMRPRASVLRPAAAVLAMAAVVVFAANALVGAKPTSAAAGPHGEVGARPTITITPAGGTAPRPTATSTAPSPTDTRERFAAPVRVVFFGDSQAMTLVAAQPAGLDDYLTVTDESIEGCGILSGQLSAESGLVRDFDSECRGWLRTWTTRAAHDRPQIAAIEIGAWDVFDLRVKGVKLEFGTHEWDTYYLQQLTSAIGVLTQVGAQVALVSVPCYQPTTEGWQERGDTSRTDHVNSLLRRAAAANSQRVFVVKSADAFCDDPDVMDNTDYRWDGTHFAGKGAAVQFEAITPELLDIPRPPN